MQQDPVQRTIRLIILSVGFVLFVMLAFRSASHVSDPQFIKGKPFLFATTKLPGRATNLGVHIASDEATVAPVQTSAGKSAQAADPSEKVHSEKAISIAPEAKTAHSDPSQPRGNSNGFTSALKSHD